MFCLEKLELRWDIINKEMRILHLHGVFGRPSYYIVLEYVLKIALLIDIDT